jgi:methylenetetrahydrofolate reductase (NADPH)
LFVITEPVHDTARFETWWNAVKKAGLHQKVAIIAGIQPIVTKEEAKKLAAKRPSAHVPADLFISIAEKSSDQEARKEGIGRALSTIATLKTMSGLRGFEIRADNDAALASEVIEKAGLRIA